jgi:ubiquinone/menaquinone biosynthesis C-methylase UbiE
MKSDDLVGDAKYYSRLATRARQQYDQIYAAGYRESDDRGINAPTHTDFGDLLTQVSGSFNRPISALELGCGTGRYFHCLRNLASLTGVDVSPDMLREAQHPVQESSVLVRPMLICANIADVHFNNDSFDLVYSIGVLGEFLSFDRYICEKAARMLKPGGKFVFTVISKDSPRTTSWKRRAVETLLPIIPMRLKRIVKARLRSLSLNEDELITILDQASLSQYTIKRRLSPTSGCIHIVCIANKN